MCAANDRRLGTTAAATGCTCNQRCGETHSVGGPFMRKGLVSLFAVSAIAFAACQGASSPSTSGAAPSTASGSQAATASGGSPAASGGEAKIDLFGTKYKPDDGTDGGQIIFADWQEATQYNPFYVGQVSEANVAAAVWASTALATNDYKWM